MQIPKVSRRIETRELLDFTPLNFSTEYNRQPEMPGRFCTKSVAGECYKVNWKLENHIATVEVMNILSKTESFTEQAIQNLLRLVDECVADPHIFNILDSAGYDLIQLAVLHNLPDVVERIFDKGVDAGLNKRNCSDLLHIACYLGHVRLVKILIENGASVMKSTHFSYLGRHAIISKGEPTFGVFLRCVGCFMRANSSIDVGFQTPVALAIRQNHGQVLRILLQALRKSPPHDWATFWQKSLESCVQWNSDTCIPHLLKMFDATHKPEAGCHALKVSFYNSETTGISVLEWGMRDGGWNPAIFIYPDIGQDDILCTVFGYKVVCNYYKVMMAFLHAGYNPKHLVTRNNKSFSPFEMLLHRVGNTNNQDSQDEIFKCVQYCVTSGVVKLDSHHQISEYIYALMSDRCFSFIGPINGSRVKVLTRFRNYNRCLSYLLQMCGMAGKSLVGVSALSGLINCLLSLAPEEVDKSWPDVFSAFRTLLQHHIDPNMPDSHDIVPIASLISGLRRHWIIAAPPDPGLSPRMVSHARELTMLLFEHGLDPPQKVVDLCIKQVTLLSNDSFSAEQETFQNLGLLLLDMFLHGVDPNKLQLISEPHSATMISRELHAQFYLTRSLLEHHESGAAWRLLSIFSMTLTQPNLNSLITAMRNLCLSNFTSPQVNLVAEQLLEWKQKPRSLLALARLVSWQAMGWHVAKCSKALALPDHFVKRVGLLPNSVHSGNV